MKKPEELTPMEVAQIQRCAEIMFPYFRGLVNDVMEDKDHCYRSELPDMKQALRTVRKRRELFY